FPGLPQLTATTGQLEFTERGLALNGIHANFLGGPMTVSGGGPAEATVIKAEGVLTADGLQKYASGASRRLAQRVSGSTRYDVTVSVKKSRADVIVSSNLQGLASDLPAPLHKEANEILPTKFDMLGLSAQDAPVAREEIKLSVGSGITARYEREKVNDKISDKNANDKNAAWHMVRGGIGVNAAATPPANGVLLNVNMKSLNVDTWLDLFADLSSADKARETGASTDLLDLSEFIAPNLLAARTTEMIIFKRKLDNVVLGATLEKDVWQANIDASQASGYITYFAKADQGKGKVTANLSSLIIPQEEVSEVTDLLRGKNATSDLPALDVKADNFDLFGLHLGHLELAANNVHRANSNEWQIKNLVVSNSDATLKVTKGSWITKDGDSRSSLTYSMDMNDAGRLLTRLGFMGLLNGGKEGKMEGDINWNGAPYSIDYASLSGNLRLDLGKGQFLKVKDGPGAAKLLGVLSLQSLPRRLTLDFRDIFSEGFAFDGVTMDATINNGVFSTDNFKMHGLDAIVLLDGSADIVKETQNLHVAVIPQLDVTGASVAYGFLVNPLIGAGSFLAQLFLKAPLAKALTHEYDITGPWKNPVVKTTERKSELAAQPAKAPTTHTVTAQ
ncbi:MAG TPA: AsmA-like C-terminal region-containing protein, partial [Burkholderiaceae bacterium]|nr:AsmA-like C-terminal region-containing protein [Burkholderiaceae bacterium]